MLRVHERCRCATSHAFDATRAKDAITNDLLILSRAYRAPDLPRQLFTDNAPFPYTTSPKCKHRDQQKWQEDHELRQATADEAVQEPDIGGRLILAWELSRRRSRECEDQWQSVV